MPPQIFMSEVEAEESKEAPQEKDLNVISKSSDKSEKKTPVT